MFKRHAASKFVCTFHVFAAQMATLSLNRTPVAKSRSRSQNTILVPFCMLLSSRFAEFSEWNIYSFHLSTAARHAGSYALSKWIPRFALLVIEQYHHGRMYTYAHNSVVLLGSCTITIPTA